MTPKQHRLISQLLWDTQLNADDVWPILKGENEYIGHVDKPFLFRRCLESYSWFTILELFSVQEVKRLLTKEVIAKLRSKSLRKKYTFMYEQLQKAL